MQYPLRPFRLVDVRHTTTFRLTAVLGMVFLAAVAVLLGLIYVLTARELTRRSDLVLIHKAERLVEVPAAQLPDAVREAVASNASGLDYYALIDARGRTIVGNIAPRRPFPIGRPFEEMSDGAGEEASAGLGAGSGAGSGSVPLRALVVRTASGQLLALGRDFTPVRDLGHRVLLIMLGSGLAAIVVALVAGIALSIGPLRRIQRLQALAARIALGELQLRLPVSGARDELDLISSIINTMVEEIDRLMTQVKGATDAIAHDLRTPLTHLRGRLDRLARQAAAADGAGATGGSEGALAPLVAGAIEELDSVLARFGALLRISELEVSNRRSGFAALDPMAVIGAVCELYGPLAEDREIELSVSGAYGLELHGDETLLFEAISNLVDNAIKFSPRGGRIALSVRGEGDLVAIEVRDQGPGIAAGERETVLRRFERGAGADVAPGSGLGLSLVAAIVHLHGFTLALESGNPGLIVRITASRTR